MKYPHLLHVSQPPRDFEMLVQAARAAGLRSGWLDLGSSDGRADSLPDPWSDLSEAAESGAMRAVSVSGGRSVAIKSTAGAPVLVDLLREHFLGCRFVLLRGDLAQAGVMHRGRAVVGLVRKGEAWLLSGLGPTPVEMSTGELVASLRRPQLA